MALHGVGVLNVDQQGGARRWILAGCRGSGHGAFNAIGGSFPFNRSHSRHVLPYGAKAIRLVYPGYHRNGSAAETAYAASAYSVGTLSVAAGGSAYAVGDFFTFAAAAGSAMSPCVGRVDAVSTGAITKCSVVKPGAYLTQLADATAPASTTGSGTSATFNFIWNPWAYVGHVGVEPDFTSQVFTGPGAVELARNPDVTNYDCSINWDLYVPVGGLFVSDIIPVNVAPGGAIGIRQNLCGSVIYQSRATGSSEFCNSFSSFSDTVSATTISTSQNNNLIPPVAILALVDIANIGPQHMAMGDSRTYGAASGAGGFFANYDSLDANFNLGWWEKAMGASTPFSNLSRSSEKLANYMNLGMTAASRFTDLKLIGLVRPTAVFLAIDINDFGVGTTWATLYSWEKQLAAELRGLGVKYVYGCTSDPLTTSSNSWATSDGSAHQTLSTNSTGQMAKNAALRSGQYKTDGVFDFFIDHGGITEDLNNLGYWLGGATADGTHSVVSISAAKATNAAKVIAAGVSV